MRTALTGVLGKEAPDPTKSKRVEVIKFFENEYTTTQAVLELSVEGLTKFSKTLYESDLVDRIVFKIPETKDTVIASLKETGEIKVSRGSNLY